MVRVPSGMLLDLQDDIERAHHAVVEHHAAVGLANNAPTPRAGVLSKDRRVVDEPEPAGRSDRLQLADANVPDEEPNRNEHQELAKQTRSEPNERHKEPTERATRHTIARWPT
jgi:hypothetical protein